MRAITLVLFVAALFILSSTAYEGFVIYQVDYSVSMPKKIPQLADFKPTVVNVDNEPVQEEDERKITIEDCDSLIFTSSRIQCMAEVIRRIEANEKVLVETNDLIADNLVLFQFQIMLLWLVLVLFSIIISYMLFAKMMRRRRRLARKQEKALKEQEKQEKVETSVVDLTSTNNINNIPNTRATPQVIFEPVHIMPQLYPTAQLK